MKQPAPVLNRVRVTNYKSIASCEVVFTPLLILVGPNGAGKSNFIDALLFVTDVLESTPADAVARRGGLDAVIRRVPEALDEFSIELELSLDVHGQLIPVLYGFTIGRDLTSRGSLIVRHERCLLRNGADETSWTAFEAESGRVLQSGETNRTRRNTRGQIEPDRLYLPLAATQGEFSEVYQALRAMLFYHLDTDLMRRVEPERVSRQLGYSGEGLGEVLGALKQGFPVFKARLDDYMSAIVPGVAGVDQRLAGPYSTVELRTRESERAFGPESISEGTLHAAGVLAALFQPIVLEGRATLLAIEEPETALHPAASGALFDALTEASERCQVIVTTQSADLLEREDIDPDWVRVVTIDGGVTEIGGIDGISRGLVKDKLATVGELMRGRRLRPEGDG